MSKFTGIEDKLDDLVSEYSRLLKRIINPRDATSAATNSAQSNNQNAPSLQTASSNQSARIKFSANSSAVTTTQQQQPSFSIANMSTSVKNNQNLLDDQQQRATVIPQSISFAALPFPPTNFTPQTHKIGRRKQNSQNSDNRQQKRFANSLLLYVPVTIRNKHKYINTYAFRDNGSNDSYLLQSTSTLFS